MKSFITESIEVHQAEHQGYTISKPGLKFADKEYSYTEDTGKIFEVVYDRPLQVSSVCDGHAGYMTSFFVTSIMKPKFVESISETKGDVEKALALLFVKLANEVSKERKMLGISGATCNVTVFDPTNARVYVASLGDSPTLKYVRNEQNRHVLDWRTTDQDCADPEEIERMIQIHKNNGDINATASSIVFEIQTQTGEKTDVWRNTRTGMMLMSSFGDFNCNYYPGMMNTIPRITSHKLNQGDVWIQCSDGLLEWLSPDLRGIQPRTEFRAEQIASHLDISAAENVENVAERLHELQSISMYEAKSEAYPLQNVSLKWVEANFDNHLTNVFMT